MTSWRKRRVGQTDLEITELGLGTGTMAGLFQEVPTGQALATIELAVESGLTFYDTSAQYGYGRAEHLLGDGLRARRAGTIVSTKAGRLLRPYAGTESPRDGWVKPFPFEAVYDYSYDGIMRSHADSLNRLGLASVDILLVHDIGTMAHGERQNAIYWEQLASGGYRALTELKAKGSINAIGLGVNEWAVLMDAFALGDWDVFLLAGRYTLLEQTALDPLLSTCVARGTSVICGGPFNSGALMGTGIWNYAAAPRAIIDRVAALDRVCRDHGVPMGAAALQFPLAHPAICTVLPGPKSPEELRGILDWWNTPIPQSFWSAIADAGLVEPGTPLPGATQRPPRVFNSGATRAKDRKMADVAHVDERLKQLPEKIEKWRADAVTLRKETETLGAMDVPDEDRLVAIEGTAGELYQEIDALKQTLSDIASISPAAAGELAPVSETLHLLLLEITELGTKLYSKRSGLAV